MGGGTPPSQRRNFAVRGRPPVALCASQRLGLQTISAANVCAWRLLDCWSVPSGMRGQGLTVTCVLLRRFPQLCAFFFFSLRQFACFSFNGVFVAGGCIFFLYLWFGDIFFCGGSACLRTKQGGAGRGRCSGARSWQSGGCFRLCFWISRNANSYTKWYLYTQQFVRLQSRLGADAVDSAALCTLASVRAAAAGCQCSNRTCACPR